MPVATDVSSSAYVPVKAPRGNQLSCKGWGQEAAMRMLMNNLDPDVAERPQDLVVYGGTGRAARNWECYHAIVNSLKSLENDETLLVQSGKPVGIFQTHEYAPRVLICNSNLVGHWSNWEKFNELEKLGLIMYGQMTAGSWIYIGSQGIIQGTYETFSAAGEQHLGGDLAGKLIVSGGMGGMSGAQPLAATMTGACYLGIEVDPERIKKRLRTGYCDFMVNSLDEALRILKNAVRKKENISVGLVGQLRRHHSRAGGARRGARYSDRPNLGARSVEWLCSERHVAGGSAGAAQERSQGIRRALARHHGAPRRRHAEAAEDGLGDLRLRQQHSHFRLRSRREERLRFSGIRAGVHSSAVLRRTRAVPLGGALGRSG